MRYARHSRHARHGNTNRLQLLAQNMRRRAAEPAPVPRIPDELAPERLPDKRPDPATDGYVGYHIEARGGGWYVLLDPDGNQVGKASRDPKELEDLIPGED